MNIPIIDEVVEQLKVMPQHLQWQVLESVRSLVKIEVRGMPGQQLLCFAGSISPKDLQSTSKAIKQDCERIDLVVQKSREHLISREYSNLSKVTFPLPLRWRLKVRLIRLMGMPKEG